MYSKNKSRQRGVSNYIISTWKNQETNNYGRSTVIENKLAYRKGKIILKCHFKFLVSNDIISQLDLEHSLNMIR